MLEYSKSIDEIGEMLSTDPYNGLSKQEVKNRQEIYGENKIVFKQKVSPMKIFLRQFKSIIIALLLVASFFSFFIGDFVEGMAVLAVIFLTALFGFITEYRAEKSVEALQKIVVSTAKVLREGAVGQINSIDLVPGDILYFEEGDKVTADARLFAANNLYADESILTGESNPVNKTTFILEAEENPDISSRKNMVFMGTAITRGNGKAIVTGTGMKTEVGYISSILESTKEESTPIEEELRKTGYFLITLILFITVVIGVAGIVSGRPAVEMIKTSIALAVAAVPEGLPAIAAITLAIGMKRMAKKNALVKRLPAVETLGDTTVICTDKTGTLTENQMTVQEIYIPEIRIIVSGTGYAPEGTFVHESNEIKPLKNEQLNLLLKAGYLCSNAFIEYDESDGWSVIGDPTEGALVTAALKAGYDITDMKVKGVDRIAEIPFDSDKKMMSVLVHSKEKGIELFVKGAPEVVLEICSKALINGVLHDISPLLKQVFLKENKGLAQKGLRVICLAYRNNLREGIAIEEATRGELVFVGLAGIADPPRADIKRGIEEAQAAGIRIIMITGDQRDTAVSVAKQIGLNPEEERVVSGAEMEGFSQLELREVLKGSPIFVRVSPKNKIDIIEALNNNEEVSAMIGDGVNDAPALKKADIGIAMGRRGTTVAKEASDMILLDDRFYTIIDAIREGRGIFDNIQKFVFYLLSCNLSEIMVIFISILAGVPSPVVAIQILWLNLVTDVFPALALVFEKSEKGIMKRVPRTRTEPLITKSYKFKIIVQGLIITIGPIFVYLLSLERGFALEESRTIGFMTLALVQLFHIFNVRKKNGLGFDKSLFRNGYLWGAFVITFSLQLAAVYMPGLQTILHTLPLTLEMWSYVAAGTLGPLFALQLSAAVKWSWIKRKDDLFEEYK